MAQQIILSAKFKRDYVAFSAVLIFCLIVVAEVALAISIPAYLQRENAMALQVRRLQMLYNFDGARIFVDSIPKSEEKAAMELRLISWDLNLLSVYLRKNSGKMTGEEIRQVNDSITELTRLAAKIKQNGAICAERKLDPVFFLNSLTLE